MSKAKAAAPAGGGGVLHTGLKVVEREVVHVPFRLAELMNLLLNRISNPDMEYGLFLKSRMDGGEHWVDLDLGWTIPRQEVSGSHIRFAEEFSRRDWNVVIHRHPSGCRRFSRTDKVDLNKEFDVSLLFIPPFDFADAVVNHKVGARRYVQLPADVVVYTEVQNGLTAEQREMVDEIDKRIKSPPRHAAKPGRAEAGGLETPFGMFPLPGRGPEWEGDKPSGPFWERDFLSKCERLAGLRPEEVREFVAGVADKELRDTVGSGLVDYPGLYNSLDFSLEELLSVSSRVDEADLWRMLRDGVSDFMSGRAA